MRGSRQRIGAAILGMALLVVTSSCAEGTNLPTGLGELSSLCGAYNSVIEGFPLAIPVDENNPGRNLAAQDSVEQLRARTASLRDAVRTVGASQTKQGFERFVQETTRSLQSAETEIARIGAPTDWLEIQRRLNASVEGANGRLRETIDGLGGDLREECG